MSHELKLAPRQRQVVTVAVQQRLAILQMPVQDLQEHLAGLAEQNPFIDIVAPKSGPGRDIELLPSAPPSLFAVLAAQVSALALKPAEQQALATLVAELREDGYLDQPLEEISGDTGLPLPLLEDMLRRLQSLEPAGIGARSLEENIALQLRARGYEAGLSFRIAAEMEQFAEGRWRPLSEQLGLSETRLRDIAALLPTLPAAPWQPEAAPVQLRLPELLVELGSDGVPKVRLNSDVMPAFRMGPKFPDAGPELAQLYRNAQELRLALAARGRTLLRLGRRLAEVQARFFLSGGTAPILPCTRARIAADLDLHPSTLGRAVQGKALQLGNSIFPLDMFFSTALPLLRSESGTAGPAQVISAHQVQRRIRMLIAAEASAAPLADEAIRAQLSKEGVDIARRTVAKYRERMRINSSHGRRRRGEKTSDAFRAGQD